MGQIMLKWGLRERGRMPNEEERRLRAALTDSHVLRLAASLELTSAVCGVENYLKLVEAEQQPAKGT